MRQIARGISQLWLALLLGGTWSHAQEAQPKLRVSAIVRGSEGAGPKLGVVASTIEQGASKPAGKVGVRLEHVLDGSPAAGAGLQPGDVLEKIDGQLIFNTEQLSALLRYIGKGREIAISYRRGDEELEATCTLTAPVRMERPEDSKLLNEFIKKSGLKIELSGRTPGSYHTLSKVTVRSKDGSRLRLEQRAGRAWIVVEDPAGKKVHEGPFETEGEKSKLPERYRHLSHLLDSTRLLERNPIRRSKKSPPSKTPRPE